MPREELVHILSNLGYQHTRGDNMFSATEGTRFDLWTKNARFDRYDKAERKWVNVWSCPYPALEAKVHGQYLALHAGPVKLNVL